ncbi:hypothetical protein IW261DRAFT_737486 [Armillaria novae-zelandiae]|uniref:Secreted protein n=1 Tax=Armillaria novae-zelandiae TaxID=153914 RepID=A0AA39KB62_9AGAR|nr:hypothetical protein IW261DRAFT_737486 [Armillaria novae-zelandiae]
MTHRQTKTRFWHLIHAPRVFLKSLVLLSILKSRCALSLGASHGALAKRVYPENGIRLAPHQNSTKTRTGHQTRSRLLYCSLQPLSDNDKPSHSFRGRLGSSIPSAHAGNTEQRVSDVRFSCIENGEGLQCFVNDLEISIRRGGEEKDSQRTGSNVT